MRILIPVVLFWGIATALAVVTAAWLDIPEGTWSYLWGAGWGLVGILVGMVVGSRYEF